MKIKNDIRTHQFSVTVDRQIAFVDYLLVGDALEVTHTEVPQSLAGRGIAAQLVEAAYNYAADRALKFTPSCPYAMAWLARRERSAK